MDRVAAMLMLLSMLVSLVLMLLALFAVAPIFCSCLVSLLYTLYLFFTNEESGVHHAQEFENRFWTIFALLFSTALFFTKDSPIAFGRWSASLGFFCVVVAGYAMHTWDRYLHREAISRQVSLRRTSTAGTSLDRLKDLGIPVEDQLAKINSCLADIDQLLIPSTINNYINQRFVLRKEREIITIFEECDARALNYLISHVKLGLLFYKIKDHRNFSGQHRTELIQLLAVDRLPALTVMSRVIVLHALQLMKLRANTRAEYWVRNVILNTHQDDLSELKTLTDGKGDYFSMNKLIYDDIKSETIRQDILNHIRREATVQRTHSEMGTRKGKRRMENAWRKILSDVDDTLVSSGGSYPAGIDKRYSKKVVYPGVLAFYRELDLGTQGPEEWPEHRVGNLVFLSARPHVYKDMSEKVNFAKFEKLRVTGNDGRKGLHTVPSLLAGDLASGRNYIVTNDMEPLALKKFDNFKRYVSIYPEFSHLFICDNGQGDVRAGEMMFDFFPYEFEGLYIHIVQDIPKTHGYEPERWRAKGFEPVFFRTYPEAALNAASRDPPRIRVSGLRRICQDAVKDFHHIEPKQWASSRQKSERRAELNQSLWRANQFLVARGLDKVELIEATRAWAHGQLVRTPYGIGRVVSFDPVFDLYEIELDWRPLNVQVAEYGKLEVKEAKPKSIQRKASVEVPALETVVEGDEENGESSRHSQGPGLSEVSMKPGSEDRSRQPTSIASATVEQVEIAQSSQQAASPDLAAELATENEVGETTAGSSGVAEPAQDSIFPSVPPDQLSFRVRARIRGIDVSSFVPPVLPKLKDKTSRFSFWTAEAEKIPAFKEGALCTTPYGSGIVEEYRAKDGVVVLSMSGWRARAFLQEADVRVEPKSLLHKLFGAGEVPPAQKTLEFPYAHGTIINTPFGEGSVIRPLPQPKLDPTKSPKRGKTVTENDASNKTIGISLTAWTLADQSHPMLYCTVETARELKDNRKSAEKAAADGLLSALGTLIPTSFLSRQPKAKPSRAESSPPRVKQYYKDGAAVTTAFGNGVVRHFRPLDGFYEVSLHAWPLANGTYATAVLRRDDISYRIAKGCHEGYPVLTSLGVSGTLASVEPTTGVHIVTVPTAGMVCYLQPDDVIRPLKAAVGEDVLTAYGDGTVARYRQLDDVYVINLVWGATLFAKAETLDRDVEGMHDSRGSFGMKWLFSFFFSSSDSRTDGRRSRSNSVTSASASIASNWSQKTPGRSLA